MSGGKGGGARGGMGVMCLMGCCGVGGEIGTGEGRCSFLWLEAAGRGSCAVWGTNAAFAALRHEVGIQLASGQCWLLAMHTLAA